MLSAVRPQAARPALARPVRAPRVPRVATASSRSGDGAGQQPPQPRRPRPPLPPAEQVQAKPVGPTQRRPAAQPPRGGGRSGAGSSNAASTGPELMAQIKAAPTCQQVVQRMQQARQLCDARTISAAANRIARLHQQQPARGDSNRAAFQQVAQIAGGLQLDAWAVAQMIWAAAKLWDGVQLKEPFGAEQAAWEQRLVAAFRAGRCMPQSVANGLWGASKLGWRLEGSLAASAAAAIRQMAAEMNSQHLANTLWAVANAGWQLDSGAAALLLLQLERVLPQAVPQAVANSLWAVSTLGCQLAGGLAAAADAAIQRTAAQMVEQAVSNTLWAFANAGWPLGSGATAALLQRLEQVLPQAVPQHVANSLWAIARLSLRLSGSLKAAFAQAVQRIIPDANSQNLANILLACGQLRWSPGEGALAAAVAAMQQLLASGASKPQELCNFLWGLAELHERVAVQLPAAVPALCAAASDWAGGRWGQLAALEVVSLCHNLARLGHRPGSAWIGCAVERCLDCIADTSVGFGNFVWACSKWQYCLLPGELERLVPAAVDNADANWERGCGGAVRLTEALTRQGFRVGPASPAATAALQGRLLPLVCEEILLVCSSRLRPQKGELPYLAGWAELLADIGLRLPEPQLEALFSYVEQHAKQLNSVDRQKLQRAFEAWGY